MEQKSLNLTSEEISIGDRFKFIPKRLTLCPSQRERSGFRFHHQYRLLGAAGTDSHEGGAIDSRVFVEDRFALLGVKWSQFGIYDVGFSTAESQSALLIEISDITDPVPDVAVAGNFCQTGRLGTIVVFPGDDWSPHGDLTDFPGRQMFHSIGRIDG